MIQNFFQTGSGATCYQILRSRAFDGDKLDAPALFGFVRQ